MAAPAWSELVRAIQAAPTDDAPRHVAADWLLARGELRGEHVALQLAVARRRGAPARDEDERVARLAAIDPRPWLAPLEALGAQGETAPGLALERGFVTHARFEGRAVANVGPLLRREPVTSLELLFAEGPPAELAAAAPELAAVQRLVLSGRYTPGHTALVRSPYLAELVELRAYGLLEAQLASLADTVLRPRVLHASPRALSARALARSRVLERVAELHCAALADPETLEELARGPLAALRVLVLDGWRTGARGLAAFGEWLGQLEVLRYSGRGVDGETLALVAAHAGRLRDLALPMLEVDLAPVLASGALDHLERLHVPAARVSRATLLPFLARSRIARAPEHAHAALAGLGPDELMAVFPGLLLAG